RRRPCHSAELLSWLRDSNTWSSFSRFTAPSAFFKFCGGNIGRGFFPEETHLPLLRSYLALRAVNIRKQPIQ
ncbi:MAG: hypothetical protein IJ230_06340, partial [Clostridia bacterium]|nr:hypothetical protein [Clostridia bacterium]